MSKICKVRYLLSEKGRKESLLSGGDGKIMQEIEAPISKELLELASVDENGNAIVKVGFKGNGEPYPVLMGYEIGSYSFEPAIIEVNKIVQFGNPKTVDELLLFEKDRLEKIEISKKECEEELKPLLEEYRVRKEKEKEERLQRKEKLRLEREEEESKKEAERLKERLKKEAEKADDENWIRTKGSKYLNQCLDLGYNCRRKYILERAEKEFPDFEVDFDDEAGWKVRVSPSQRALDEVTEWINKGFEAKIVWLTASVHGDDYDYENEFEPTEAITIKFKGYDLVKEL